MIVQLASGDSACSLLPLAGGSIESWRVYGQDMLRAATSQSDPLQAASFPLVPYSNRIANGRFEWNGRQIGLAPHPIAKPHSIHGVGWLGAWDVFESGADFAVLRYTHDGDDNWPWPFLAEQRFKLGPDNLSVDLTAQNLADKAVPLSFGHHPYFDSAGASLRFAASRICMNGDDNLPEREQGIESTQNFAEGRVIGGQPFDNLFTGWNGAAEIVWADRKHGLRIVSDLPHAQLYVPLGQSFFCFEPVAHRTNALNSQNCDMPGIAPGQAFAASIRFTAFQTA